MKAEITNGIVKLISKMNQNDYECITYHNPMMLSACDRLLECSSSAYYRQYFGELREQIKSQKLRVFSSYLTLSTAFEAWTVAYVNRYLVPQNEFDRALQDIANLVLESHAHDTCCELSVELKRILHSVGYQPLDYSQLAPMSIPIVEKEETHDPHS